MSVVITGMGVVSPIGIGVDSFWENINEGKNNFAIYSSGSNDVIVSQVKEEDFSKYLSPWLSRKMDRICLMSTVAAKMAFEDAKLSISDENCDRIGGIFSTYFGSFDTNKKEITKLVTKGIDTISPFWFPMTCFNTPLGAFSRVLGLKGVSSALVGSDPLLYGKILLEDNRADAIIIVSGDELDELYIKVFSDCGVLRRSVTGEINPKIYDGNNGFVYGEGWGAIVLEREDSALKRGAEIYGRLTDIKGGFDITLKTPLQRFVNISIDLISELYKQVPVEHGRGFLIGIANGTNIDDKELTVFKEKISSNYNLVLSNIKGCIGETFSSSGILSLITGMLVLKNNVIMNSNSGTSSDKIYANFDYGIIGSYQPNGLLTRYFIQRFG